MAYYGNFYDYLSYLDKKLVPKPFWHRCNNCGVVLVILNEIYLECPKCKKSYYVR